MWKSISSLRARICRFTGTHLCIGSQASNIIGNPDLDEAALLYVHGID